MSTIRPRSDETEHAPYCGAPIYNHEGKAIPLGCLRRTRHPSGFCPAHREEHT